ncbi:hypothetical protein V6N13_094103 [Hibiscus sabdariffa]
MVVSTGLSTEALEEIHDTTRNTEAAMEDIVSASSNLGMPMVVQDGRTDGTGEKMTEVVSQPDVGRVVVEHIEASSSRAEDLYEPWMLVDTRRRRSTPSNGGSTPVESGWITNDSNGGSMSTALEGVEEASM